jgi:addiction module HigA family antidote
MDQYGLNPTRLARDIGLSQPTVRQLVLGKMKISAKTALHLAKYFRTKPEYWLNVQSQFELAEAAKDSALNKSLQAIPKAEKLPNAPKKVLNKEPKKRGRKPGSKKVEAKPAPEKPFAPRVILIKKQEETGAEE